MKANTSPSENRFRKNLRHKLEDAEMAPPTAVWEQIDAHLEQKRKRKSVLWWISAAASLVLLFGLGWLASDYNNGNKENTHAVAINPVWIHPTPASKNKAATEASKLKRPIKTIEKKTGTGQNPPASINERPINPVRSSQRWVNQVAEQTANLIQPEQEEIVTIPNLNSPIAQVALPLELAPGASLVHEELLEADLPVQKSRKVYGIGFGPYKLKISLASKE